MAVPSGRPSLDGLESPGLPAYWLAQVSLSLVTQGHLAVQVERVVGYEVERVE